MFRLLVLSAATALVSSAAFAADLPLPRAPAPSFEPAQSAPPPADEPSHSGAYAGLEGGGGFNNTSVDFLFVDPAGVITGPAACVPAGACLTSLDDYSVDGGVFGGRLGFNVQSGRLVFGVEGDLDWSGMEGSRQEDLSNAANIFVPFSARAESDYDYIGTLRARVGVAMGRVLVYGTAGAAFAQVEDYASWGFPSLGQVAVGQNEEVLFGWTAGAGVDFLVTNHIVVGFQGLYFDLEDQEVSLDPIPGFALPAGTSIDANFEHTGFLAKGHVSFKFGGGMGGM